MTTSTLPTDLDTRWRDRVHATLASATWAELHTATPGAGWPGHDGDQPVPLALTGAGGRARWMWALAEHLARHDGQVVVAQLGPALVDALQRSKVTSTVPMGLVPGIDLATVEYRARRAAALAQPHPDFLDAAALEAIAVAAVARAEGDPGGPAAALARVTAHARTGWMHAALRRVRPLLRQAATVPPRVAPAAPRPQRVATQLATCPRAARTLPAALAAFLLHRDDPVAAVRFAARTGGDPRATAMLTAALCGAHHGGEVLPQPLELTPALTVIADAVAGLRAR